MFTKDVLEEIAQWRSQSTQPHHQLDWRWIERFRKLSSYDSRWWLTWAGPFTNEEQTQWDSLITSPLEESIKAQLGLLLKVSRERELTAAIEDQREPQLYYPAIVIQEIRRRIQEQKELAAEIERDEPNAIVRRLYQGAIAEEIDYLRLIEATYERNSERFWECSRRLFPLPTPENMKEAFAYIAQVIQQGQAQPETATTSQQIQKFLQTLFPEDFFHTEHTEQRLVPLASSALEERMISAAAAQRFFLAVLRESGYDGWQVVLDSNASSARVEQAARYVFLPNKQFPLSEIKHLFVHELAGHVARCVAGEHSALGLLGIHTRNSLPTEEGIALYHERQVLALHGQKFDDSGMLLSTFLLGLASGVGVPAQTFSSLYTFLQAFTLLSYHLSYPEADTRTTQQYAQSYALDICLRVYRGVPDLTRPGVCYLQDAVHLYGLRMVEKAVAEDARVLDRLAVGVCALEDLPDLYELGITSVPQPLRKLAYTVDLDNYILSFEE